MVHLCNIKMSAVLTRHKSKGKYYDIDGFITQLLASRKFDDLAEKLAEKAANKIKLIDAAPAPVERATDENKDDNSTDVQEVNQSQLNREYVKKYENNQFKNVQLRKDFTGKINPQAVMNATISLSENLQLKYKYLKKNALEKKAKSNRDPVLLPKNDTKEDQLKHNKTTGSADFKDQNNKTVQHNYNQNATEKTQNNTKKESINEYKRSRDDTKDDDRTQDPNKNSELNESFHSGTDSETNDSTKKQDHSLEEQSPVHELTISRAQNSRPEDKGTVEQEVSHVDLRKEKASSFDEENQKHLSRSEQKIIEEVKKTEREPVKRGTGEINEDENVIAQFRAREDSIEENKLTSNYNVHVGVYRTRVSADSGDGRSKEQSPEDQRSKEQSPEDQSSKEKSPEDPRSKEQSPEDQSSKEQSAENLNSSKLKPVIRKEGDKLYTYVRAPEYEDYHEKLAKWRKRHPVKPAEFMK